MSEHMPPNQGVGTEQGQKAAKPAAEVTLPGDISLYPAQRLPEYDVGETKAYAAQVREKNAVNCFALVCERQFVPRRNMISAYTGINNPNAVPLMRGVKVFWPPAQEERFVFIYKNVLGKQIAPPGKPAALGWRPDDVMEVFVKPLAILLRDFRSSDFVHGSIRVSNLYDGGATQKIKNVILGDCLSGPPSYAQPMTYETIQRGMAIPSGRGPGTFADDIYSFGVTLAMLLRTRDPLEEADENTRLRHKIEHGSFSALVGNDRFKGSILELLRGVLHDESQQRWTIDEILEWIDGRRQNPKQPIRIHKAPRPIVFADKKYFYTAPLAMDFSGNTAEANRIVESGDLEQWLERAVEDEELIERVNKALESSKESGKGAGYEDRLAANLASALDPSAPVRYKSLSVMGQGFGTALAEAMVLKKEIKPYAEIFADKIVMTWLYMREAAGLDVGTLLGRFDSCRSFLLQPRIGYGLERCLYLLSPEAHCLSEKLKNYYVCTSEDLLRAFEDLCRKGHAPAGFMDRHTVAFLSVRDSKVVEPFLRDIDSDEEHKKIMGNMKCLASIQKKYRMENVPAIARVFAQVLPVVYARFHDRTTRENIEKSVRQHVDSGDIFRMAMVLDNAETVNKDFDAFRAAMQEYTALTEEAADLDMQLAQGQSFGRESGKEIAAVVSSIMAVIIIIIITCLFLSNHGSF